MPVPREQEEGLSGFVDLLREDGRSLPPPAMLPPPCSCEVPLPRPLNSPSPLAPPSNAAAAADGSCRRCGHPPGGGRAAAASGGSTESGSESASECGSADEGWCASSSGGGSSSDAFSEVGEPDDTEVVYVREGVAVRPSRRERIPGRLSLVSQHAVLFLSWLPYGAAAAAGAGPGPGAVSQAAAEEAGAPGAAGGGGSERGGSDEEQEDGAGGEGEAAWAAEPPPPPQAPVPVPLSSPKARRRPAPAAAVGDAGLYAVHPLPLSDVCALVARRPPLGAASLTVVLASGLTLPTLYFQQGGCDELLQALGARARLARAAGEPNTLLVDDAPEPMPRHLAALALDDMALGAPPPGASSCEAPPPPPPLPRGQPAGAGGEAGPAGEAAAAPRRRGGGGPATGGLPLPQWPGGGLASWIGSSSSGGGPALGGAGAGGLPPQVQWLGGRLRQAGRLVWDGASSLAAVVGESWHAEALRWLEEDVVLPDAWAREAAAEAGAQQQQQQLPPAADACPGAGGAPGAEVDSELGSFELCDGPPLRGPLDAVRSRPVPPPLGERELEAAFLDADGALADEAGLRRRLFEAGAEPGAARRQAWLWLLGVHPPRSTRAQREALRARRASQYGGLLGQWRAVGREQAQRFARWREVRAAIDKDVARTDRQHPFFHGRGAAPHLRALRNVLRAYSLFNFDVGYCQGMSDLAAPLLVVMGGDEVDAFWCFVGLMERVGGHFAPDQSGMRGQLDALRRLVQLLDPQLHARLEEGPYGAERYCFAFRWLLVTFKREFALEEVLRLWEACWSCPATPHLPLYLAAALLVQHRRVLLGEAFAGGGLDPLLRWSVDLAGRIDLASSLALAEALALSAGPAGEHCLEGLP